MRAPVEVVYEQDDPLYLRNVLLNGGYDSGGLFRSGGLAMRQQSHQLL